MSIERRAASLPARIGMAVRTGLAVLKGGTPPATGVYGGGTGWSNPWSSYGGFWGLRPGSERNAAADAGDPLLCPPFAIAYGWILRNFPEPKCRVTTQDAGGEVQPVPKHPLPLLLRHPNDYYDGNTLWAGTIYSYIRGNAFWYKQRSGGGYGKVAKLYYIPHWEMRPLYDSQGYIERWQHLVNGRTEEDPWPKEDVVHFRNGVDPHRPGFGMDQLAAVFPEMATINEGTEYGRSTLTNMGVPGVIITPKVGGTFTPEQRDSLKELFKSKFTGSRRGEPLGSTIPADITFPSVTPEDMALNTILDRPEDRLAAIIGLSSMLLGLTSGANAKTYANMQEARQAGYHDCIIPMQGRMAEVLDFHLLTDLGNAADETVGWDYSEISVLQEDRNEKAKRVVELVAGGVYTPNEGRVEMGKKPLAGDPLYDKLVPVTAPKPAPVLHPGFGAPDSAGDRIATGGKRLALTQQLKALAGAQNGNGKH